MTLSTFIALLPALLGLAASGYQPEPEQQRVRTVVVQNELIMRIPVRPAPAPRIEWVERDGPECIATEAIRGAALSGNDHVNFLMAGRRRLRAELGEDCRGLDYYEGFYLNSEDDRICAGRDVIRLRMGGSCRIERFHKLVPRRK